MFKICLLFTVLFTVAAGGISLSKPRKLLAREIAHRFIGALPANSPVRGKLELAFGIYPLDMTIYTLEDTSIDPAVAKLWRKAKIQYLQAANLELPLPTELIKK